MKHTYRYVFAAKCPSDGETIIYGLEIRSNDMIRVEAIKDACAGWQSGFQEEIAEALHAEFPVASMQLRAQHQGVEIVTVLEPAGQSSQGGASNG